MSTTFTLKQVQGPFSLTTGRLLGSLTDLEESGSSFVLSLPSRIYGPEKKGMSFAPTGQLGWCPWWIQEAGDRGKNHEYMRAKSPLL